MSEKWWFLTDTFNFIPDAWKYDGTYTDETWPASAIEITDEEVALYRGTAAPEGKRIGALNGRPAWVDLPPPTPEQVLAAQSLLLQQRTQLAAAQKTALTNRISVINDAIELEMATPEEEAELPVRTLQLKAWKTYAVLLGRVTAQAGWYTTVVWPVEPAEGMDLTVSAATQPETV